MEPQPWPDIAVESNPINLSQLKSLVILENALAMPKTGLTCTEKKRFIDFHASCCANKATNYAQLKRLKWNEAQIYGQKCTEFIARIIGN